MKTIRWHKLGPLALIGLAALLNLAVALRPDPVIDLGPIDLTPGATTGATFRAGYREAYGVGIRMDQKVAERLYPCTVSAEAMDKPECKNQRSSWPLALALRASSEGRELTHEIKPNRSDAGGEYEGTDVFTWTSGYIDLIPGKIYHLNVRSIGRSSMLQSAKPRLVVSAAGAPGLLEGMAIQQLAAWLVSILLVASAAIWTFLLWRRREPAAN